MTPPPPAGQEAAPDPRLLRGLKLRDLHYLMVVVHFGSMARAAAFLAVSQPVVSKVIADLEQLLGERMLDRTSRGVAPTVYGRRLLASGQIIFDELREGALEIAHLADATAGELVIGCDEDATLGVVPLVLETIRRKHPNVTVHVRLTNAPEEERAALRERQIAFAVGRIDPDQVEPELETELLFNEQFSVLASSRSPWTGRRRIDARDLADASWVMPPPDSVNHRLALDMFRRLGMAAPHSRVRTSSLQLIQRLLTDGPYLALLPRSTLLSLTNRAAFQPLPVELPAVAAPIGVTRLANRALNPAASIFIAAAREAARALPALDHGW